MIKKILKSKIITFNMLVAIFGAIELNAHYMQSFLGDTYYGVFFISIALINTVLRFYTTKPLEDK